MKIEKINDNQIRCTLNKEDLEDRDINLSELAFGTGKTKELFQDMMQQANDDFGFEVNDIPLMVEAMPLSSEGIVLVITKVEHPEDTKSHFSNLFSKEFTDDFFSKLESMKMDLGDFEEIEGSSEASEEEQPSETDNTSLLYSIYVFDTLNDVISVAGQLLPFYKGDSSVYKSPQNGRYYLSLCMEAKDEHLLNKICSILTEQGEREEPSYAKELFYVEHFDEIIADQAIEKLGSLK